MYNMGRKADQYCEGDLGHYRLHLSSRNNQNISIKILFRLSTTVKIVRMFVPNVVLLADPYMGHLLERLM